jgi:hypothetical protein
MAGLELHVDVAVQHVLVPAGVAVVDELAIVTGFGVAGGHLQADYRSDRLARTDTGTGGPVPGRPT